jgi:hypothetical protein
MCLLIFISVVLASQHSSATPNREKASVSASTAIEKTVCRLSLHRSLLQTHPDLRLTQNVADFSCLTCRPTCSTPFTLTASACSMYAGQHTTACLQRPLGICETHYNVRHLVCCINHHRPLPVNTATLLPVVYCIWLKNIATTVDVDNLQLRVVAVGLLRRRRRSSRSALVARSSSDFRNVTRNCDVKSPPLCRR